MSDELKEKYQKDFSQINPSPEFLERLTIAVEQEQAALKRRKFSASKLIPAAAAFVLIFGAGGVYLGLSGKNPSASSNSEFSEAPDLNLHQAEINSMHSFENSADAENYADMLLEKLSNGELDYIKVNNSNNFTSVSEAELSEADKITELLSDSELTESCPDGEKMYYMLVFKDESIEKLIVTDGKFIEVSGKNIFFQKK